MLATFAFDVCHDVYRAAREAIDSKIPTLNAEAAGKYQWRPDRLPRLAEYVCDFARAGERALGEDAGFARGERRQAEQDEPDEQAAEKLTRCHSEARSSPRNLSFSRSPGEKRFLASLGMTTAGSFSASTEARSTLWRGRASRVAMFRIYYLGGAEYHAARRQMGISELTWADWAEEIRRRVGRELTRAGLFPPAKYFRETAARAS